MGLKKACYCLSLRLGSLILLYLYLIGCVWALLNLLTNFGGDPIYKQFLKDNAVIFSINTILSIVGAMIFLATIVSISNENSSSIRLLSMTIAFLIVDGIFGIYSTIRFISNGTFQDQFQTTFEKEIKFEELFEEEKDVARSIEKARVEMALQMIYFKTTLSIIYGLYTILVFYNYYVELKQKPVDAAPAREHFNDEEAYASAPPVYKMQVAASQYPTQPPLYPSQYLTQSPQYPAQDSQRQYNFESKK